MYIPSEDRIRVSGDIGEGKTSVIWLTRRMSDRLVPVLTNWIEKGEGEASTPRADLMNDIKQQRVSRMLKERSAAGQEPPVDAANPDSEWLALSVDMKQLPDRLSMIFKDSADQTLNRAALTMATTQLRQWLSILLTAYKQGGWPLDVWPEWMLSGDAVDGNGHSEAIGMVH